MVSSLINLIDFSSSFRLDDLVVDEFFKRTPLTLFGNGQRKKGNNRDMLIEWCSCPRLGEHSDYSPLSLFHPLFSLHSTLCFVQC